MEDRIDFEKLEQHAQDIKVVIANEVCNNSTEEIELDTSNPHLNEQSKSLIKDSFANTNNGEHETFIKTIFGAATVIAQERGELKELPKDANAISSIIDDSYYHSKLSWLVSKGAIAAEEAIDELIDRAHIRVFAFFERVLTSESLKEVLVVGLIKSSYFIPEIGPVVAPVLESNKIYIHVFISSFECKVRNVVEKSLNKIACAAKQVVATIRKKVEKIIIRKVQKEKELVDSK